MPEEVLWVPEFIPLETEGIERAGESSEMNFSVLNRFIFFDRVKDLLKWWVL